MDTLSPKILSNRIKQCLLLAEMSHCVRRKFGCVVVNPTTNVILSEGYNGGPRNGSRLCGADGCERDTLNIESGTHVELGCYHAEMNAVCNAARHGTALSGAWAFVTGEPCEMCAKLLYHAGIVRVVCVQGGYFGAGEQSRAMAFLRLHGVAVQFVQGPTDPRFTR